MIAPEPPGAPPASGAPPSESGSREFSRAAIVITAGLLATGLGWPGTIGHLPFGLLLKNQMHASPQQVSAFWAVATMAWYVKPLVGVFCDSFPILGTRRRGYLVGGAILAGVSWMGFIWVPRTYVPFLILMTVLNFGLVSVSTAIGGMLVEEGQRQRATGRFSALRAALEGVMAIVSGRLGGLLAAGAFVYTAVWGAAIVFAIIPLALFVYREPTTFRRTTKPWTQARTQLKVLATSRPIWMSSALLFLVFVSPGLQTPLMFYQQDVLRFQPAFMGTLQSLGGVGALAGAFSYGWICRRVSLRVTLVAGLVLGGLAALLYLFYGSATAALWIEPAVGFLGACATLPLYDLIARATPAGSESLGYALMLSVRTISLVAISDPLGSVLYGRFHLSLDQLIVVNAISTFAVLLFVPFLPRVLLVTREDGRSAT